MQFKIGSSDHEIFVPVFFLFAIQGVQPQTAQVTGYVPAGYYARLRTVNVSGAPLYQFRAGQEILQ